MNKCSKCNKILDIEEIKNYDGICRKCLLKDIKNNINKF